MRRICVFAGSNPGADPAYAEAARDRAALLDRLAAYEAPAVEKGPA